MRRIFLILLLVWPVLGYAQSSEPPDVSVVQTLDPDSGIRFGDTVSLIVETTRPANMEGAPTYPDINIPGAIALAPEQSGTSFAAKDGAQEMTTFRFRYAIVPQRVGQLEIPPLRVGWTTDPSITLLAEGLSFDVATLPDVKELRRVIVSPRAAVSQTKSPDGEQVATGDAIVRQIEIAADDTIALTLPPAIFDQIEGLASYPDTPILNNTSHRGTFSAGRTDRVTYIVEQPGSYTLPELTYEWWNSDRSRVEVITLPAISFEAVQAVLPDQTEPDNAATRDMQSVWDWLRRAGPTLAVALLGVIALVLLVRRYGHLANRRVQETVSRMKRSEPAVFRRLLRSCAGGNTPEMRDQLWRWLQVVVPSAGPSTIETIQKSLSDPALAGILTRILSEPFAPIADANAVSPAEMKIQLSHLRKSLLQKKNSSSRASQLQPLNPRA